MVFIIKEQMLDSLENSPSNALYKNIVGYVPTEEEAKRYCLQGKHYTNKDCWAIRGEDILPQYTFTPLVELLIQEDFIAK